MTKEVQRKLNLVIDTGLLLARCTDLRTIVQAATDAGRQLCGAQFGAFFYNAGDASGERYLPYALSGAGPEQLTRFFMPRNTNLFAPIFEGTAIVRSDDITRDPKYDSSYELTPPHSGAPQDRLPIRSYLAVPVQAQSREVLGGLFYGHADTGVFPEEAEDLVAAIAAQAASAIENFRLNEQLTRKVQELEKAETMQRELARHMAELAAIVESSDDSIISKDLTGCITSWNQAAVRILGYTPQEIIGKSILTVIPKELYFEEEMILEKIRSGQRVDHYETTRITKTGQPLDVSLSISPIRDASGIIVGASKILRDISSRKRMERSVIQAEKIAATGRMAATIAHEINNPLEAVTNLLYLARLNASNPQQVDAFLSSAENEVHRVSHIAKQTLGFYREHTSAVSTTVSQLVDDAVKVYEPKCSSAGVRVETRLNSTREVTMRKGEMMQVISNLITNAIYAMPSGGTLSISVEDTVVLDQQGVQLTVSDNGIGIPENHLSHIFEAFFTTRNSVGTGIGLFVARQFIEGHAGQIKVRSSMDAADHGTTFSIFLPLNNPYSSGGARPSA